MLDFYTQTIKNLEEEESQEEDVSDSHIVLQQLVSQFRIDHLSFKEKDILTEIVITQEFMVCHSLREQIGIIMTHFPISRTKIAKLFGINRSNLYKQFNKYTK
jgi:DNA-binding protein Fis